MSAIKSTLSTANCSVCSWVAKTAKSASNAVIVGTAKISSLASNVFQALAQYAHAASGYMKTVAAIGLSTAKANPQIALGSLAVLALVTAAYAYKTHFATT